MCDLNSDQQQTYNQKSMVLMNYRIRIGIRLLNHSNNNIMIV